MYEIAILCVIRFSTYGTWIRKEKNIDSCHSWEYFNAPMCSFPLYGPDRPSYLGPSVFRSSFTLESVRAHFFLLSPSSSPLFFFLARVKLKIVDRNENSPSLFLSFSPLSASLVAARVVDFRLKPEICSNIRAVMFMGTLRFVQVSPDFFARSRLTTENTNHATGNSLHSISIPVMGFSVSWLDDASSKN